jgi:hypothetical protein
MIEFETTVLKMSQVVANGKRLIRFHANKPKYKEPTNTNIRVIQINRPNRIFDLYRLDN